ncbi:hypothetical protein VTK73DRAFT_8816 [Phialemonium thermophilum]|uniref:Dynein light chain n=1 Tax=Phialemonium thermophilum TaxID=223376 RepID=A0ABR3W5Z7_9PEZI
MASTATPPVPIKRLEQIATDACNSALSGVEFYDHSKTGQWNQTIIEKILKAVTSEATPQGATPAYKFAINSTIVQHVVPNSQLNRAVPAASGSEDGKKTQAGRRGMHSATAGYWNEKTDGMWSFKFDGGDRGLDVVIMLIWIAI